MKNFFIKHLLRLQSVIRLLIIESTAVEIFKNKKIAIFEAVSNKIMPIEEKKRPRYENTTEYIYFLYSFMPFYVGNRGFYARNP